MLSNLRSQFRKLGDKQVALHSQRYFKTGPGEYGEGDKFIGIRVPAIRKFARQYKNVDVSIAEEFVQSTIHEERLLGLLFWIEHFKNADDAGKRFIYETYMKHTQFINNWDLVDISADKIVGAHLYERNRQPIFKLRNSASLWERRIAIMSTLYFIRHFDYSDTLLLSESLLHDREDLIHKAVGWMLREVGKRDRAIEEQFLKRHYKLMPRTMLRYAIEKFPLSLRRRYLEGKV